MDKVWAVDTNALTFSQELDSVLGAWTVAWEFWRY